MASSIHPRSSSRAQRPGQRTVLGDKCSSLECKAPRELIKSNSPPWQATTSSQHQVQSLATHPISSPREPIRSSNTPIFTIQTIDITMETVNGKVRSDVWNLVTSSVTII
ncbi:hypothetical protein FOIG_00045 [Fusarium odoratissimum NRRL 54006]|uniref:Uncharacterized protein n=1 Tax=Fusarium odoratissimum (strain NRRL 54006) TaxID=1089451 RepID=X0K7Z2_FUSO5|nr:uncharacterized protein FOIG_00045 [Fusarium odoratissimum NRRL 54006]EXM09699.1 hypothetical protein FOIG_00045 [Fusarium odoratissimum NRRL 54006]